MGLRERLIRIAVRNIAFRAQPHRLGAGCPTTRPLPLPPGFPSMEFPPPKIAVEPGHPQPIATKYGLTYDIPADWDNGGTLIAGWEDDHGPIKTYGGVGEFGYGFCGDRDGATLAMTGATGRNGVDLDVAAREDVDLAARIFADDAGRKPRVAYSGPSSMTISGRPAVRYTATVTDIPADDACDPPSAQFDVVATPGYATADVMIFMVQLDQGKPEALARTAADQIISTLRAS